MSHYKQIMSHYKQNHNAKNTSIMKQLILNKLYIPYVLIDIIKDYLFYDKITTNSRNIKRITSYIIKTIDTASFTRARDNTDENWYFGNTWIWNTIPQIYGRNCFVCGEYKVSSKPILPRIECDCLPDLISIFTDTDNDDNEEFTQ